jgi:predicted MFS family arabinose efflux permease
MRWSVTVGMILITGIAAVLVQMQSAPAPQAGTAAGNVSEVARLTRFKTPARRHP